MLPEQIKTITSDAYQLAGAEISGWEGGVIITEAVLVNRNIVVHNYIWIHAEQGSHIPTNKFSKESCQQQENKVHNDKSIECVSNIVFPTLANFLTISTEK